MDIKKLKYKPCQTDSEDEVFHFLRFTWNITKMKSFIENNREAVEFRDVPPEKVFSGFIYVNEEYAKSADTSKPVILVQMWTGEYMLVDGNHRAYKAHKLEQLSSIKAYALTFEQQVMFLQTKFDFDWMVDKYKERVGVGVE